MAGVTRDEIHKVLAARPPASLPEDATGRRSAVLVPLVERGGELVVLLTKRTDELPTHKGQISFPGGSTDPSDRDTLDTALRETEEELGIARDRIDVLGALDPVDTVTGFRVFPHVGYLAEEPVLLPNAAEIAEVLFVPLSLFLDKASLEQRTVEWKGQSRTIYAYVVGPNENPRGPGGQEPADNVVWGATALILKGLCDRLSGRAATDNLVLCEKA